MPSLYISVAFCLLVVAAGVSVALQQVLNANLRTELGSPLWAGFASYSVGELAMLVAILLTGEPIVSAAIVVRTSWFSWAGGIFGAFFIGTAIFAVPRLGAATVLALIVVGQMLGSMSFDHLGLFSMPHHPATPVRLSGAALLIAGVVMIRL